MYSLLSILSGKVAASNRAHCMAPMPCQDAYLFCLSASLHPKYAEACTWLDISHCGDILVAHEDCLVQIPTMCHMLDMVAVPPVSPLLQLMAVGVPVAFLGGGAVCWGRLVYAWRAALKFKVLPEDVKPRNIHRFLTEFDVEVASRIGRVWDVEGTLDQTALEVAENVLKVSACSGACQYGACAVQPLYNTSIAHIQSGR
jgi:hypothetical protein